jgi:hypothetical protein
MRLSLILTSLMLLFSSLACRAATRLIIPDTPTPLPPTPIPPTPTVIPPTPTPTLPVEASCPLQVADILDASLNFESSSEESLEEEIYLATYYVDRDEIYDPSFEPVPSEFRDEQDDRAAHEDIWNLFTSLIPLDQREFVVGFSIVTDGGGDVLAAVGQSEANAEEWVLEVDILDSDDRRALTFTLLHEFAHLLTLNASQVPPNLAVFDNPFNDEIYKRELAACPNYFPGEGCSNPDSYINLFFDQFWFDLYAEWQEIDEIEDEDEYYDQLDDFYDTYEDQFLSDYSATSPAEDIAEAFAFFILEPKPSPDSVAKEKILFFHDFPELVQLRGGILNSLCAEFP